MLGLRKKIVIIIVGIVAVLIGGSLAYSMYSVSANNVEISEPEVPQRILDSKGWTRTSTVTDSYPVEVLGFQVLEGSQSTVIYSNEDLAEEISRKTMGAVDTSVMQFFTARVVLNPSIDSVFGLEISPVVSKVESQAEDQFRKQMRDSGLEDIEQVSERDIKVDSGETGTLKVYEGFFPIEDMSFDVSSDKEITIGGEELEVKAYLASWHDGDSILIAGGAFPSEDYEEKVQKDLTEAIEVSINIDLGLRPTDYQNDLIESMKTVR